jgi:hypothetical protein
MDALGGHLLDTNNCLQRSVCGPGLVSIKEGAPVGPKRGGRGPGPGCTHLAHLGVALLHDQQ